jgi:predicted permease
MEFDVSALIQDLKFGLRMLAKRPGFTAAALICLALGIGATTGIFSVVNTVLLRPLPYAHPKRLMRIYTKFPKFPGGGLRRFWVSAPEFLDIRRDAKLFQSVDAWVTSGVNLSGTSNPLYATASFVSGGLLRSLGVAPALGRLISPADDEHGANRVADISYGLWQRAYGGEPNIIGRDILLNGQKTTIIGVMPRDFHFPLGEPSPTEVWTPLQLNPANPGSRSSHYLSLLGFLKPDVTPPQAQAELASLVKYWGETGSAKEHHFDPATHTLVSYPYQEEVVRGVRPALLMQLGAVCFVLLIACVNVANLLLARAEGRRHEIAIRSAMGATRAQLTRQFIIEGILLSAVGTGAGLLLTSNVMGLLKLASLASIPRASAITLDGHVALFAVGICFLTAICFGLAPLIHFVVENFHEGLRSGTGRAPVSAGAPRFRHTLVVCEMALALMLLIGAGLMVRAFWKVQEVNAGFNPKNVITMQVSLPDAFYSTHQKQLNFWSALEARLANLSGAKDSALFSGLPPVRPPNDNDTKIEGFVPKPGGPLQNVEFYQVVSPGYFKTMGVRLIAGRLFNDRDGPNAPKVAIVNETMARTFWGNQSPIGRRLRPWYDTTQSWWTVVGVVGDVKNAGLEKPTGTELYLPYQQAQAMGEDSAYIAVRTSGDPSAVVSEVRHVVHSLDPTLPLAHIRSMDSVMSAAQSRPRFLALLLTLFSIVALTLAAVGIYGVISYSVAQRTREFGIRMALGAQRGDVLRLVLGEGMTLALAGVGAGVITALGLTRLMASLLYGIKPADPATFALVSVVLFAVAFLACYIPARRATKIDPMTALRYE